VLRLAGGAGLVVGLLGAAGTASTAVSTTSRPLIEHWDGNSWTQETLPTKAGDQAGFESVTAISPTDVWALAAYRYAYHWDGSSWQQVALRVPRQTAARGLHVYGAAAVSGTDVWAVGSFRTRTAQSDYEGTQLIEHWDGRSWRIAPSPRFRGLTELVDVAALSPRNVWAVGYNDRQHGLSRNLVLHWNGAKWKRVPCPRPGDASALQSIAAISPRSIWTVGWSWHFEQAPKVKHEYRTLTLHWNGRKWKKVRSPNPPPGSAVLSGVAAVGRRDVWAVGTFHHAHGYRFLAEHWTGRSWSVIRVVTGLKLATTNDAFGGPPPIKLAAVNSSDIWAAGSYYDEAANNDGTLIEHWDGKTWSRVPNPNPGYDGNSFAAIAAASPTAVWAVGMTSP